LSSNRRSVVSASSEGRPVFSARLRCRADERCAPSIRRYAGPLGPDARVPEHGPWICGQSAWVCRWRRELTLNITPEVAASPRPVVEERRGGGRWAFGGWFPCKPHRGYFMRLPQ